MCATPVPLESPQELHPFSQLPFSCRKMGCQQAVSSKLLFWRNVPKWEAELQDKQMHPGSLPAQIPQPQTVPLQDLLSPCAKAVVRCAPVRCAPFLPQDNRLPESQRTGVLVRRFPSTLEMWEPPRKKLEFLELSAVLKPNLAWQESPPYWKISCVSKAGLKASPSEEH